MSGYTRDEQKSGRGKLTALATLLCLPAIAQEPPAGDQPPEDTGNYEVCAAYRADIDADLGDVLRAGSKRGARMLE